MSKFDDPVARVSETRAKQISEGYFAASRLTLARERRGLTRKELAARSGVTPDAITKFEAQSCRPTPETVQRFVFALQFPIDWFYGPEVSLLDSEALSFRARRSMTAIMRGKATRAGDLAVSIINAELRRRFVLPPVNVPDYSGWDPEEAAAYLRRDWNLGIGPIYNMVQLLENKGVCVYWMREESPNLNAWSLWQDDLPFVMLNIFNDAGCRARFDAAHELGHIVLHRGANLDGLEVENEANLFASAFLLPADQFQKECPRYPIINSFFPLKKRWGVSLSAMMMRCKQLGIFSEWEARRAFQELSARGWRTSEPKEIAIERELSRLQVMLGERLVAKKIHSEDLAREMRIMPQDLKELMPFMYVNEKPRLTKVPRSVPREVVELEDEHEDRKLPSPLRLLG